MKQRRRLHGDWIVVRLLGLWLALAAWISPRLVAQDLTPTTANPEEETGNDSGAQDADEARPRRAKHEVPVEYRSGSVPNEPIEIEGRFDRAEDHFAREEWAPGLAIIDEILAEATSPDHAKWMRQRALERRRAMEQAARERAAESGEQPSGAGAGGEGQPGRGPRRDDEEVSDDELSPTVEVYSRDGIIYLPVAAAARERLIALPIEARRLYRRTYDAPAEQLLEKALRLPFSEGIPELERLAKRYPLTESGRLARREWALRLADGARTREAAHVLDEGLRSSLWIESSERPVWLALSSLYHLLAGQPQEGRRRLLSAKTNHSEVAISVRGTAVLGADLPEHDFFVDLLLAAEKRAALPSAWPTVMGSYRHVASRLSPEQLPPLGTEARWIYRLREPLSKSARQRTSFGTYPVLQAVSYGDLIHVRKRQAIVAIDRQSGKLRWSADPGPPPPPQANQRYYIPSQQPNADYIDQGGKALTLYKPSPDQSALILGLDYSSRVTFASSGKAEHSSNHLMAYDATTGKLRWTVGAGSDDSEDERGLAFTAPPVAAGGLLVIPATRDGGYYLVGIHASGAEPEVKWISRYYSFSTSYYIRYGSQIQQGNMVAAAGGVVYFAPGHGIVGAAEASTGRLLWLSRYRSRTRLGARYNPYLRSGGWTNSHPVLVRGETRDWLVTAPQDSDYVTVFDPVSGRTEWDREIEGPFHQLVGADEERIYVAGDRVRALAIATGEEVWTSESIGSAGGHGFVAAGRVYLPARGNVVAALDAATGEISEKYTILDPRVSSEEPINIFPIGGELVALTGWGLIAVRGQSQSWELVQERQSENLFQRARLLRGSGRYAEALEILYRLLEKWPEGPLHKKLVSDLVTTVTRATDATEDPRFIRELLERGEKFVSNAKTRMAWRLREAELLAESSPEDAAAIWFDLLPEGGQTVGTPDGNQTDVGVYASDQLRHLLFPPPDASDEQQSLARKLAATESARHEEAKTREILAAKPSETELGKVVIRRSHTASAAEAAASLAGLAIARGEQATAANLLELLLEDFPALRGVEEIEKTLAGLTAKQRSPEVPRFRLAPLARVATEVAPDGGAEPTVDVEEERGARGEDRASGRSGQLPYREVFWRSVDEGVLVATAPGSDPLPAILAVQAARLKVLDADGETLMERELPGFPDLEDVKASLQSHIEEPFIAHLRDERLVLFTAGGCYGFHLAAPPSGTDPVDAGEFRIEWVHPYAHPLEQYRQNTRVAWGAISVKSGMNLFPLVFFDGTGDPRILFPDGELMSLDRWSGKISWRVVPEIACQAVGDVRVEDFWRPGSRVSVPASTPPGLLRYRLPDPSSSKDGSVELLPAPEASSSGAAVDGVAHVFQGSKLMVVSASTGRRLWTRSTGSRLVHASAGEIWTSGSGDLEARSIRSGRLLREVELPSGSQVVTLFEDPRLDGDGWTLVTTGSGTYVASQRSAYYSRTQTGAQLHLVRLDPQRRAVWSTELASGPVTYDGNRLVLEDGRWLFTLNEQESETEKWYTRLVAVSPEDGVAETWLRAKISGKGTGQPARLASAMGGIALGNSEGFGWFIRENRENPTEGPAGDDVQ